MTLREALEAKGLGGDCVVLPFEAVKDGEKVRVTAVLNHTAVYEDHRPERHIALQEHFEVGALQWREAGAITRERAAQGMRGRQNAQATLQMRKRKPKRWRNKL